MVSIKPKLFAISTVALLCLVSTVTAQGYPETLPLGSYNLPSQVGYGTDINDRYPVDDIYGAVSGLLEHSEPRKNPWEDYETLEKANIEAIRQTLTGLSKPKAPGAEIVIGGFRYPDNIAFTDLGVGLLTPNDDPLTNFGGNYDPLTGSRILPKKWPFQREIIPITKWPSLSNFQSKCCKYCQCGGETTPPIKMSDIKKLPNYIKPLTGYRGGGAASAEPVKVLHPKKISLYNKLSPKSYLTTVGIQNPDGVTFCSGVIVSSRSILTAAHCVCGDENISKAFVGSSQFTTSKDEFKASLVLNPKPVFKNKNFCSERVKWKKGLIKTYPKWDLAILHLSESLPKDLASLILPTEPIAYSRPNHPYLYGVGFGVADGVNVPGTKNRSRLKFASSQCNKAASIKYGCRIGVENIAIAHTADSGADSCTADSGGPILARNSSDTYRKFGHAEAPELVAITSRGLNTNTKGYCGKGSINTNVGHPEAVRWIRETIQYDF